MRKAEIKDKQCIDGVCQFCARNGRSDKEEGELEDGWIVLSNVTAQFRGIYGEWCGIECFVTTCCAKPRLRLNRKYLRLFRKGNFGHHNMTDSGQGRPVILSYTRRAVRSNSRLYSGTLRSGTGTPSK